MANPIQKYIDKPVEGRLPPQPKNEMLATRIVKFLLRLK